MTTDDTNGAYDDEVEMDLSEATGSTEPESEPIDWDAIDFEEEEPEIAPLIEATTSWGEIDADAALRGDLDEPEPEFLPRNDGPCLLYRGKVHSIAGEPESGKGWFALSASIDVMGSSAHVVYVDFEDTAKGVFGRLKSLGIPDGVIRTKFHYVRPDAALVVKTDEGGKVRSNATWVDFLTTLKRAADAQGGLGLIVFDGITEALGLQGIASKDNEDVAEWFGNVPRRLAHNTNAAVLLVDHVAKATDSRSRFAIGAQAKLSALDGCQFIAEMKVPFARGRSGVTRVFVAKDRPGHVRAFATGTGQKQAITDMQVNSLDNGRLTITFCPPDMKVREDGTIEPTGVQQDIIRYLKRVHGGRGKTAIITSVRGRNTTKIKAFQEMLDEGWLAEYIEKGKTLYRLATPEDKADAEGANDVHVDD